MVIKTFKCAETEALFGLRRVARFSNIERPALRKLKQLDLARRIEGPARAAREPARAAER